MKPHLPPAVSVLRDWLLEQHDEDGRPVVMSDQLGMEHPPSIVWMAVLLEAPEELVSGAAREVQWARGGVPVYAPYLAAPGQSDRLPNIVRGTTAGRAT